MHHVKSDARNLAYGDKKNPFARYKPNKRGSAQSRLESGTSGPASRVQTSTADNRRGNTESFGYEKHQNNHQSTIDDYVHEPTAIEKDAPQYMSPQATDSVLDNQRAGSDETSDTQIAAVEPWKANGASGFDVQNEGEKKQRKGVFGKLFGKKDDKHAQEHDSNGKDKQHFTLWSQLRVTLFGSWINILLICCPVGIALHYAGVNPVAVFVVNFIAIIPLAGMLSYATEEIALRTGEVIGGLLNATFGNAVELIVSIIALFQNQFLIVQTSLLGSMLSNLLLVMGMCFFAGGYNRIEQAFNITVAQTASSLLFLAVACLIIPTAFEAYATPSSDNTQSGQAPLEGVIELSRGTAIILLFVYCCYLFFQLKSHVTMYTAPGEKNKSRFSESQKQKWKRKAGMDKLREARHRRGSHQVIAGGHETASESLSPTSDRAPHADDVDKNDEHDDEPETPQLSLTGAILTLLGSTVLVALNAEYLVDAINAVTCSSNGISKTFVGLILLPIVGNAAEHATAVTVAIKDKMDLAIGVAVGSSMQIALLVLPLVVVIGWIAGKDGMTLYFDGFQLIMLFVAILLVNYLIQDGKSHWLEGILLMCLYVIIAVAAWFYPTSPDASGCET